jgi:hypothetical protein
MDVGQVFPCGSPHDGRIVYVAECHCRGCGHPALGLTVGRAAGELRGMGWSVIGRRWFCPDCAQAMSAATSPSAPPA